MTRTQRWHWINANFPTWTVGNQNWSCQTLWEMARWTVDALKRITENEQCEIEFESECDSWQKRKETFENNLTKVHGLTFGRCTKGMVQSMQSREDFEGNE